MVDLSADGARQYVSAQPPKKKRRLRGSKQENVTAWEAASDFGGDEGQDEVYSNDFDMSGWKQYTPAFAMDVSGELVKDLDPKTGKRKWYESSVSLKFISCCKVNSLSARTILCMPGYHSIKTF